MLFSRIEETFAETNWQTLFSGRCYGLKIQKKNCRVVIHLQSATRSDQNAFLIIVIRFDGVVKEKFDSSVQLKLIQRRVSLRSFFVVQQLKVLEQHVILR